MEQVHKETLEQVENALPGRESIDLEIFGTEGIPESEVAAHNQRIMAEYAQKEADRRAASGQSNGPKKPKIDISKELDPEEIKKKLEAHKKAMASGGVTPVTPVGGSMSPGRSQSPGGFDAHASPQVAPPQISYVSRIFIRATWLDDADTGFLLFFVATGHQSSSSVSAGPVRHVATQYISTAAERVSAATQYVPASASERVPAPVLRTASPSQHLRRSSVRAALPTAAATASCSVRSWWWTSAAVQWLSATACCLWCAAVQ